MPRRPTGSLFRNAADRLYIRVLVGDNDRESFPLDPKLTEKQAEQRKELVADLAARLRASRNVTRDAIVALLERAAVREGRALRDVIEAVEVVCRGGAQAKVVPGSGSVPKQVTLQQFGELWTSGELARMYPDHVKPKRSVEQDVYRFDRHIYPIAGRVPVASFTLDDAERASCARSRRCRPRRAVTSRSSCTGSWRWPSSPAAFSRRTRSPAASSRSSALRRRRPASTQTRTLACWPAPRSRSAGAFSGAS
ncbi:uncharacterized protein SOCE836_076750 [Sorangium cellulosum]|uniref:Uncharacterized protein n=1 Tax=Sorangium cellulosum TaxID=56 RepID=A0A4V0NH54_SORCE|nr:uncharacterized protein SOCE836_076750 [Sorangium cellulosum]